MVEKSKVKEIICKAFSLVYSTVIPPPTLPFLTITMKADSGASEHYMSEKDENILQNTTTYTTKTVGIPNGELIDSSKKGYLPLNFLSASAKTAYSFPNLKTSLLSVGQLCDDDCDVLFNKNYMKVEKHGNVILNGIRNRTDGLWDVHFNQDTEKNKPSLPSNAQVIPKANVILRHDQTKEELVAYLHGTMLFPTARNWIQKIRQGNFKTWPGLTPSLVSRYLQKSIDTYKGHMKHEAKNLRSTRSTDEIKVEPDIQDEDTDPKITSADDPKVYECYAIIQKFDPKEKAYLDLTGRFPYISSRGNQYLLVVYDYDSNAILVEPLKNRQAAVIRKAWEKIHTKLVTSGVTPKLYVMDNEASYDLKNAMKSHSVAYELVPPHTHRRNAAERAIQTFKNHFLAGLSGVHPEYPIHEWDRLLDQAVITLNLLRNARANPRLSAYAYLFGDFDFNRTPMAPIGTKVLAHTSVEIRGSWDFRGVDAWYIGPSLEHYRCVKCFVPKTNSVIDCDTVEFFPHKLKFPEITHEAFLRQAISDIVYLLQNKPSVVPTLEAGHPTNLALQNIATLLNRSIPLPPSVEPGPNPTTLDSTNTTHSNQRGERPSPRVQEILSPRVQENVNISQSDKIPSPRVKEVHEYPQPPRVENTPQAVPQSSTATPMTLTPVNDLSNNQNSTTPVISNKSKRSRTTPLKPIRQPRIFQRPLTRLFCKRTHQLLPRAQSVTAKPPRSDIISQQDNKEQVLPSPAPTPDTSLQFPIIPKLYRCAAVQQLVRQRNIEWLQNRFSSPTMAHIYNKETGKRETLDSALKGPDQNKWSQGLINELGRLAQGGNDSSIPHNDCIEFVPFSDVPNNKKVTYGQFVLDYRPLKADKWRVRLVVGGDKLDYTMDAGSPAASLIETKLLLNSVISDHKKHNSRFMTCDIKDFFLASPMRDAEYMRLPYKHFPSFIKTKYGIDSIVHTDGYVYIKIKKGMYGLKQAAILAYDQLVKNLAQDGYEPCPLSVGIWKHKTRAIKFCLCVDDFGIKYNTVDDAEHLLQALRKHYTISTDWTGAHYCGLSIDWHYKDGYVDICMPGYLHRLFDRLKHKLPKRPVFHPHDYTTPAYGKRRQYAQDPDMTPPLEKEGTTFVQSTVGSLLYYGRATDSTMLPALNEISTQQSKPTEKTLKATNHLLDYAATYPLAIIRFYASDMILAVESDAAYLVLPAAKSRIAGYFHMTNSDLKLLNGAILVECQTLKHVVASAAEAETGGLFHNAQLAVIIRQILHDLGHPQPPTPIKTDNSTANNFVHSTMKQKRSKSWDMRYNWLRCREAQKQVKIYWEPGKDNNADYFTKHHPPKHHLLMRPKYIVHDENNPLQKSLLNHLSCEGVLVPKSPQPLKLNQDDVISVKQRIISAIGSKLISNFPTH